MGNSRSSSARPGRSRRWALVRRGRRQPASGLRGDQPGDRRTSRGTRPRPCAAPVPRRAARWPPPAAMRSTRSLRVSVAELDVAERAQQLPAQQGHDLTALHDLAALQIAPRRRPEQARDGRVARLASALRSPAGSPPLASSPALDRDRRRRCPSGAIAAASPATSIQRCLPTRVAVLEPAPACAASRAGRADRRRGALDRMPVSALSGGQTASLMPLGGQLDRLRSWPTPLGLVNTW